MADHTARDVQLRQLPKSYSLPDSATPRSKPVRDAAIATHLWLELQAMDILPQDRIHRIQPRPASSAIRMGVSIQKRCDKKAPRATPAGSGAEAEFSRGRRAGPRTRRLPVSHPLPGADKVRSTGHTFRAAAYPTKPPGVMQQKLHVRAR